LRNPLTGFLTLTSLIKDKSGDLTFNKLLELINSLNSAAQSLNDLLGNLLIWSKSQTGDFKINKTEFPVYDKVLNIVKLFSTITKNKEIEVIVDIDKNLKVICDPFIFDTIIRNLLVNAIKFSNVQQKIIIDSTLVNNKIKINITDFGVGIKEDTILDLFKIEKKITTLGTNKEKGTGLGLKLCKELALKQNSEIEVKSVFGKGSTFSFVIINN